MFFGLFFKELIQPFDKTKAKTDNGYFVAAIIQGTLYSKVKPSR